MANRFTERAQRVVLLAQEEAKRLSHNYVGTEHMLLGLVAVGEGVAFQLLKNLVGEPGRLRAAVEARVGPGQVEMLLGEIPFTPQAKKVLEYSVEEAQRFGHSYVGTEHLLIGLLREGEGAGARVLEEFGLELERAREAVLALLGEVGPPKPAPAPEQRYPGTAETPGELTDCARWVLQVAEGEARRLKRAACGTEHVLLGLLSLGEGVVSTVLSKALNPREARALVETLTVAGEDVLELGKLPWTVQATRAFAAARRAAELAGLGAVGPEELLLGLLRSGNNSAARVLRRLSVPLEQLAASVPRDPPQAAVSRAAATPELPLDRLSERSLQLLAVAREQARGLNHDFLGTEHLLLGFFVSDEEPAQKALSDLGLTLKSVRAAIRSLTGRGKEFPGAAAVAELHPTPRLRKALELGCEEAKRLGWEKAGPEHILFGLLSDADGTALQILARLGVEPEKALAAALPLLRPGAQP